MKHNHKTNPEEVIGTPRESDRPCNRSASPDFDRIKYFLLDMDGTFYIGNRVIKGSMEFISKVLETNRDFLFLTNNSSGNAEYYEQKLRAMGIEVESSKIFTTCEATAIYLRRKHPRAKLFVIGNDYLKTNLLNYEFEIVEKEPDYVIVGTDTTLTWEKLIKGCRFIEEGVPYIATHPDKFCPSEYGRLPCCGAITDAIKATTDISPYIVIGKPNAQMVESVLTKLDATADRVAMCGDRIPTDVVMANRAGMTSCLIMSGETSEEMLLASDTKPKYVFQNLAAMIPYL